MASAKALPGFVWGVALAIGPRNLQAIGDVPGPVLFDNGREFVVHCSNPLTKLFGVRTPQQVYRKIFLWSTCLRGCGEYDTPAAVAALPPCLGGLPSARRA